MEKKAQSGQRLVLVPCPYQGHINPMLRLATLLGSKGFSISIVHTHFNSPNPSNHPEFTFFPIPDGLTAHEISSGNVVGIESAINANCKASLEQCLTDKVMQQEPKNKITCIIYDEFMYYAESVANYLSIPSIILRTQSATNIIARNTLLQLHSKDYTSFAGSRICPSPFLTLENYSKLLANVNKVRTSSAVIWNTPYCLEQSSLAQIQQQYQVPIFPIGPLHKVAAADSSSLLEEDTSCIAWLDKQPRNAVIYVSLGSLAYISEKELAEMAWGLANNGQPFFWVIRPGSICGSDWIELLPQGFLEAVGGRGCIVKWAPQMEVLAHGAVGRFWTHCGWNSTLESMSEGVPMLCRPCFSDQKVHARYVSQIRKIGLHLENELERREIGRAVRKLMVDDDGKGMRVRAMEMKEKIEVSLRKDGSSYNSLNELVKLIRSF